MTTKVIWLQVELHTDAARQKAGQAQDALEMLEEEIDCVSFDIGDDGYTANVIAIGETLQQMQTSRKNRRVVR